MESWQDQAGRREAPAQLGTALSRAGGCPMIQYRYLLTTFLEQFLGPTRRGRQYLIQAQSRKVIHSILS